MADRSSLGLHEKMPMRLMVVAAVAGLVALLVVSTGVAVILTSGLRERHDQLRESNVPYAQSIATAALAAKAAANDERGYLLSGDPKFVRQLDRRSGAVRVALANALRASDDAQQHRAADEAWIGFERWLLTVHEQFQAYRAGEHGASIAGALGPGRALRKSYEASLARAEVLANHAIRSNQASVADASKRSIAILIGCLLVGLLAGLCLAVWLVRTIVGTPLASRPA